MTEAIGDDSRIGGPVAQPVVQVIGRVPDAGAFDTDDPQAQPGGGVTAGRRDLAPGPGHAVAPQDQRAARIAELGVAKATPVAERNDALDAGRWCGRDAEGSRQRPNPSIRPSTVCSAGPRVAWRSMRAPGPLLAAGREADIFEYGPGLVLRRSREGRSLVDEARIMEFARSAGYPVPAVDEVSDDGCDMVMERLDGDDMGAVMMHRPWTIARQGRVLADLHVRLHELAAPPWLQPAPVGEGDRLVHLDLHPLNVLVTRRGPVVIDWTGASRGAPDTDVALAWTLMAAGSIPANRLVSSVLGRARSILVKNFLSAFDVDAVRDVLPAVVAWKVRDPHMSAEEQARMWKMAERPTLS
jgi:hypothetical protein